MFEGFKVISTYTRMQAIQDGELIDVSELAKEAGFKIPVAVTSAVYHRFIVPPYGTLGQSETGRLWDVLNVLFYTIKSGNNGSIVKFRTKFLMSQRKLETIELKALCHPGDDMEPVITIMLSQED